MKLKKKNIFNISKKIILNIFNMFETRIKLLSYEIQEIKKKIIIIFCVTQIISLLILFFVKNFMNLVFLYFKINNALIKTNISILLNIILLIFFILYLYIYTKNTNIFHITLTELNKDKDTFKKIFLNLFQNKND